MRAVATAVIRVVLLDERSPQFCEEALYQMFPVVSIAEIARRCPGCASRNSVVLLVEMIARRSPGCALRNFVVLLVEMMCRWSGCALLPYRGVPLQGRGCDLVF